MHLQVGHPKMKQPSRLWGSGSQQPDSPATLAYENSGVVSLVKWILGYVYEFNIPFYWIIFNSFGCIFIFGIGVEFICVKRAFWHC